jgi:hypothetical protein
MHPDHLAHVNQLLQLAKDDVDLICTFHTNLVQSYITLVG